MGPRDSHGFNLWAIKLELSSRCASHINMHAVNLAVMAEDYCMTITGSSGVICAPHSSAWRANRGGGMACMEAP